MLSEQWENEPNGVHALSFWARAKINEMKDLNQAYSVAPCIVVMSARALDQANDNKFNKNKWKLEHRRH